MIERLIPWDRWYPQRAEGLIDIAWAEGVLPAHGGACPICGPACSGHDQRDPVLRPFVAPVLIGFTQTYEMPERDQRVIAQMLAEWGIA